MAADSAEICEKFGLLGTCDVLPRAMKSTSQDPTVFISGCMAIATLGLAKENRVRFSPSVACEVVAAGLQQHGQQHAEVAEKGCMACISLALGHLENAGKLVLAGACSGECYYDDTLFGWYFIYKLHSSESDDPLNNYMVMPFKWNNVSLVFNDWSWHSLYA